MHQLMHQLAKLDASNETRIVHRIVVGSEWCWLLSAYQGSYNNCKPDATLISVEGLMLEWDAHRVSLVQVRACCVA